MHWHILPSPQAYTGAELTSHWIYRQSGLLGSAILAFAGPCHVKLDHLVDLEDVRQGLPIYSRSMLHVLVEHFETRLTEMVLRQRLLVAQLQQVLTSHGIHGLLRQGDDLYDGPYKLTVSIATVSPVSGLIHLGLNIDSRDTPVPTRGLQDYQVPWEPVAHDLLQAYIGEEMAMNQARSKVRWVP